MSGLHQSVARTGLPSWDQAEWSPVRPSVSHVVPLTDGFGFLCQHRPHERHEPPQQVVVPPAKQHILLTWRRGASVEVALGGGLVRRRFDRFGSAIIPEGASSRWISGTAAQDQCLHLHFSDGSLRATAEREEIPIPLFHEFIDERTDERLMRLAELAFEEAGQEGGPSPLAWQSLAMLVHLHVLRGRATAKRRATGGLSGWQLRRVSEHMLDHLSEDVSLVDLAAIARLSPYHFCRAFKQSTGVPPHRWLQMHRVERAKELLATGATSVIEAAGAVGYDNPGHFARLFKRETGVTPREFKRQFM